jgi:hypothetical protein
MDTIQDFSSNALLSDASYARDLRPTLSGDPLARALFAVDGARFKDAEALAKHVGEQYVVLDQYTANAVNGFSATVFQNKETGEVHLAFRGTEVGPADLWADAILAVNGAASNQIVELINYVKRLEAGAGNQAPQYAFVAIEDDNRIVGWEFQQIGTANGLSLLNQSGNSVPFGKIGDRP